MKSFEFFEIFTKMEVVPMKNKVIYIRSNQFLLFINKSDVIIHLS